MMRRFLAALLMAWAGLVAWPAAAQDDSLADIRQQLAQLYADVQGLRGELVAGTMPVAEIGGASGLERLTEIEDRLQTLISKTESLEARVNRITVDGTNRIGDLEFRICELEAGCDVSLLGDTPSLGGVDSAAQVPVAQPAGDTGTPELAVSEQADFTRAQEALASGDFRGAADQFAAFVQTYPGGPLTSQALYLRGLALEAAGDISDAARSYLDSFSGEPQGDHAPDALFKLGVMLGQLGQVPDACVTLNEVVVRFPAAPAAATAQAERVRLACQ